MNEYINSFFHKDKKVLLFSLIVSGLLSFFNMSKLGMKDSAMFFLATFLLINDIYLIFKDRKKSVFLFVLSFPIVVTARKICFIDLFIIKLTYESIYVTLLFIMSFKGILKYLRDVIKCGKKISLNFYVITMFLIIFIYNANIYSLNIRKSFSDTYIGVITPILFMLCCVYIITKEDMDKIKYSLILSVNFSCLYGLLQIFKDGISLSNIKRNRALLTFGYHNVNIFAGILITVLPLLVEMILYRDNNKKAKTVLYSSLLLQVVGLMITFTRGAWICFLLEVFILLISKKYRKVVIVLLVLGVFLAKPALGFIISRGNQKTTFLTNESSVARIQSIFTDVKIMQKYPFGIGMSSFPEQYKEFAARGYLSMPEQLRWKVTAAHYMLEHAHNLLLQIGVEFGIVSLVLFILLIINRIKVAFENYSQNRGLITSIIIYVIFSTLTGNEFNHKGVITGTLIIFLIFALIEVNNTTQSIGSKYTN